MTDAIYVVGEDDSLAPVMRTPYALEDDLQELLAKHPELLPGDQIDPENPRRWLLIRREAAVGTSTTSNRWSLDHLFVDQDAIPTLVEAKRGGNPEARRQVVAQLLEYAANGTLYWPIDQIRSWFEEQSRGQEAARTAIAELTQADSTDVESYEAFWSSFEANLRDRRIRLIFVADDIPPELKTLVEFINEQMSRVEVLAVEVVQYTSEGRRMLRPQLVGQTARAQAGKERSQAAERENPWTTPELIDYLAKYSPSSAAIAKRILAWAEKRPDLNSWGNKGLTYPRINFRLSPPGQKSLPFFALGGQERDLVEISFGALTKASPFSDPAERASLHAQLRPLTRMSKGNPDEEKYAYFDSTDLTDGDQFARLLAIMDSIANRIVSGR